jgi:protein involved in polysaccharide export with SLBB domain
MKRASPARRASLVLLSLLGFWLAGCNATPDKRVLQYLNTDGFGNRYSGNSEEENWVAIGDSIGIDDPYEAELRIDHATVDIDGTVVLPELGAVVIAGLTRTQIESLLMEKYSPYFDRLDIKVRIFTQRKKYFIFGEVTAAGEQDFPGDLTLFEAVMRAAPKTDSANLGRVRLIRPDPRDPFIQYFDVSDLFTRGDSTFNVHVHERDIIYVPPTMLAEFGYFLDSLLFPVKYVLTSLSSAIFSYNALRGGAYYGGNFNNNNNNGIF